MGAIVILGKIKTLGTCTHITNSYSGTTTYLCVHNNTQKKKSWNIRVFLTKTKILEINYWILVTRQEVCVSHERCHYDHHY